jgi:hypothetical protein
MGALVTAGIANTDNDADTAHNGIQSSKTGAMHNRLPKEPVAREGGQPAITVS